MSGQRGPVEPGRPAGQELPMDADVAIRTLAGVHMGDHPTIVDVEAALRSLQGVVRAARAYVKGRTVGRFVALAHALHEAPDVERGRDVTEAQVERFLADRGQMRISLDVAQRLGLWIPPNTRGVPPGQ